MQLVAALNIITMLATALQGLFNMVGAAIPVGQIIKDHLLSGKTWSDEERDLITKTMDDAFAKADQQITDAGAPPTNG